jgi:hypothetical protein
LARGSITNCPQDPPNDVAAMNVCFPIERDIVSSNGIKNPGDSGFERCGFPSIQITVVLPS